MINVRTASLLIALLAGCRAVPVPPPPPTPPKPLLERTFGDVRLLSGGGLLISYKELRLAVDPAPEALSAMAPQLDFVLLTQSAAQWPVSVRRDLKVLAPEDGAGNARKAGFTNAKPMATGQRLMLSKAGQFLFVGAVQARHPSSGLLVNGYLMEFDNGRNVFVAGDFVSADPLREFVYQLRDDGKELHLAFINAGGVPDEPLAAELASLLQARVSVIRKRGKLDTPRLNEAFASQIMSGGWFVASTEETVPF